ncbi:MBL fold metallo-hydrolase [Clostridium sediminicola]|uniref:MBL fold metallo-hydrolase n=1 Tax=Clostridium sediminicola TaxID=3114879 RepID=UPI0031F1F86A
MSIDFEKIEVGYMQENCYIVIDTDSKEGVIIDPGADALKISEWIDKNGINVKYILLTHGHYDHTGAVDDLLSNYQVPLLMNKKDYDMIETNADVFGKINSQKPERFINDGDEIYLGSSVIKCISTPGHSAGGMCFLTNDLLFAGDTLFYSSMGRWDLPGGDYNTLMNSIRNKLLVLPENTKVMPGHGPNTLIKNEKRY